jgi:hypothetical protein
MNRFTTSGIISHLNRFISVGIVSQNSLTCTESIHLKVESYHSSSWAYLNRFTHALNRFILHAFLGCLLLCESIHSFSESIDQVVFVQNFALITLTIYSLLHTFTNLLNHLHLFSLGLKNALFIHSSRLNTFY